MMLQHTNTNIFTSKANTLKALSIYPEFAIPPLYFFTYEEWIKDAQCVVKQVMACFASFDSAKTSLAVRSSCSAEDSEESSGAGAFTSLLHIANEKSALHSAITEVFASYKNPLPSDQVLVQVMLTDIIMSGVIMTCSLEDGAPYYIINYDESGSTDSVTSGRGKTKVIYVYRNAKPSDFDSKILYSCVEMAMFLEQITATQHIDIEFCVTTDNTFHLLQARPMCTQNQWSPNTKQYVHENIEFISNFLDGLMSPREKIYGETTFLGVMPDWNPAEMIGTNPKLLASSLYRELITKRVWSLARKQMGYRSMPADELMVLLAGRPYIDVRLSFNSFLPADIEKSTGTVLVNAWLERFKTRGWLHDKIEFEVAQTLLDFSFEENLKNRYPNLLSLNAKEKYKNSLRLLTYNAMQTDAHSSFTWAMQQIEHLKHIQSQHSLVTFANKKLNKNYLPRIINMLEECQNLGTLPFSILARHAFMAESLLRTASSRGAFTPERLEFLKSTMKTVASEFSEEFDKACLNPEDKTIFLYKYGHLRPSTYNISSPRYIDRDDLFSNITTEIKRNEKVVNVPSFTLTNEEHKNLTLLLKEIDLDITPEILIDYASRAIPAREYAKFIFTRHVSDILEWIALWGDNIGFSRDELSYLDIRDITEWGYHALLCPPDKHFQALIQKGQNLFDLGKSLKLSYLIRSPRDLYVAPQHNSRANYIGQKSIEAPLIHLTENSSCSSNLEGHIVCIENADPGFDWIFTRNIAGLITMFGGANSHMAIRCAEYSLPAAIGVGSTIFDKISSASRCLLDAGAGVLKVLQ